MRYRERTQWKRRLIFLLPVPPHPLKNSWLTALPVSELLFSLSGLFFRESAVIPLWASFFADEEGWWPRKGGGRWAYVRRLGVNWSGIRVYVTLFGVIWEVLWVPEEGDKKTANRAAHFEGFVLGCQLRSLFFSGRTIRRSVSNFHSQSQSSTKSFA